MKQLVHDLLITETVPLSLTAELVARYVDAEPNIDVFIQALVEIIADIKEPMVQVVTTAMKENQRRVELQVCRCFLCDFYTLGQLVGRDSDFNPNRT